MYVVAVCCRGVCGRVDALFGILYCIEIELSLSEINLIYIVQKLPGRYLTKPDT